jgi:peptidoglycan/xylan/chitin deacetylase (PgdA/CDA1 family)
VAADRLLRNRDRRALFLCYHSVAPAGPKYLTVSPELFERQLDTLEARGIRGGGLDELERAAAGTLERPTAFLTFDDGFLDNYETVLPLLRERGHRAFVFVLPPLVDVGGPLAWPEMMADLKRFPDSMRSVDWEMLGEMQEGGFEVGSHTLTHPHLSALGPDHLRQELSDARSRIVARFGGCDTLAYPFGDWAPQVAAAAADCGYRFAFTLPTKTGQDEATPLSIPRVNIDYRDEGRRFAAKASTAGRAVYLSTLLGSARRLASRR